MARLLDIERRAALSHRLNRIDQKRRDGHAIAGGRVERRANDAEGGEFPDQRRVDRAGVRANRTTGPEPVCAHEAFRSLAVYRIETVENGAIDVIAGSRLFGHTQPAYGNQLRFLRCGTDRSKVSPIRRIAGFDLLGDSLDHSPSSAGLSEKKRLVNATVVAAPVVRLE